MSRIRITPLADQDLAEIWYSIAQDDPVSADRLQERAGKCTLAWDYLLSSGVPRQTAWGNFMAPMPPARYP
jgi:hypothetical protein